MQIVLKVGPGVNINPNRYVNMEGLVKRSIFFSVCGHRCMAWVLSRSVLKVAGNCFFSVHQL